MSMLMSIVRSNSYSSERHTKRDTAETAAAAAHVNMRTSQLRATAAAAVSRSVWGRTSVKLLAVWVLFRDLK